MGRLAILFSLLLCGGCTYQYTIEAIPVWTERFEFSEHHTLSMARGFALSSESVICVHGPVALTPAVRELVVSRQVADALQPYFAGVHLTSQSENKRQSLFASKRLGCGFLLYPQIITAKNNQSSLSEVLEGVDSIDDVGFDRFFLKLSLWDVETDRLVDVSYLESRTQFFKITNNEPLDLLAGALDVYVKQIVAFQL